MNYAQSIVIRGLRYVNMTIDKFLTKWYNQGNKGGALP